MPESILIVRLLANVDLHEGNGKTRVLALRVPCGDLYKLDRQIQYGTNFQLRI